MGSSWPRPTKPSPATISRNAEQLRDHGQRALVIQLQPKPGAMGLPGHGSYNPAVVARYRAALIQRVRVTQDATLRRYGLAEALVDGTFRIRLMWPYNGSWGDGHHIIGVIFTHCAGRWQLYDPYYHYYSLH